MLTPRRSTRTKIKHGQPKIQNNFLSNREAPETTETPTRTQTLQMRVTIKKDASPAAGRDPAVAPETEIETHLTLMTMPGTRKRRKRKAKNEG